ncbi:hypothetical protein ZIOFF_019017 [Zingiber officinale]|uniref:Uncharacterized protein n=1 Tax=Zingiber officinale TaxID=94328 RepID=A0A8J5H902_ZINOF|nr:hypothetical protein ZIOFF_019017 [Zingiber officinale]
MCVCVFGHKSSDAAELWSPHSHSPRSILCAGKRAKALTSSRRLLCPKPITSSSALASLFATPAKVWLPYLLLSSGTALHTFPSTRVVPIATADTGRKAADHLTVVTPDVLCLLHREDRFKDREFGALAVGHSELIGYCGVSWFPTAINLLLAATKPCVDQQSRLWIEVRFRVLSFV